MELNGDFDGKVALVTGGSSGIGRATALAFAHRGAKVIIGSRQPEPGEEAVGLIRAAGGTACFVATDVSHEAEVERLVGHAVTQYGRLDYACNNAATTPGLGIPLHEYSREDWYKTMDVNLTGVWLCLKYELRQMLQQGNGAIVNVAAMIGLVGTRHPAAAHTASKHGVVGLTKAAALEYAHAGIRVNAVCPSYVRTPLLDAVLQRNPQAESRLGARLPLGRLAMPEEIAEAVVWLCSGAASFVTGHALAADGGYLAE